MSTVAYISAEAFELAPLARRRRESLVFHEGAGFVMARRAAERAVAAGAGVLVSVGLCGALSRELTRGEIVVDEAGLRPRSEQRYRPGRIVSQDRVAWTVEEKAALAGRGVAVEMESGAVREVAARHGLGFAGVKVVSDLADEPMPMDFNAYRDDDGRFDQRRIALAALGRPWVLPKLMRLRREALAAAERLGDFLAHCEF